MTDNKSDILTIVITFIVLALFVFGIKFLNKQEIIKDNKALTGTYVVTEKMGNNSLRLINLKDSTQIFMDSTHVMYDSLYVKINDTIIVNNNVIKSK